MPSELHEHMAEQINRAITTRLDKFIERSVTMTSKQTPQLAGDILTRGSADMKFLVPGRVRKKYNKNSPDKSYRHRACPEYPGLVIEVAWSQRPLELHKLAKRYIQRSNGRIRTVVGINIEYQDARSLADFSVWRAGEADGGGKVSEVSIVESEIHRVSRPVQAAE